MDPCIPGISLDDARAHARIKLGVPAKYANKMSVKDICKVSKMSSKTMILPPMEYRQYKGKMYLIDPKSPLSIKDFFSLLVDGKLVDIQRIGRNIGLLTDSVSKNELKSNIIKVLKVLNISEPIEIPSKKVRSNNGTQSLNVRSNYNNGTQPLNVRSNYTNGTQSLNVRSNYNAENETLGPESGETPYNEDVAPHLYLAARPSKVHVLNRYSPSWPSPSPYIKTVSPSKVTLEPITEERIYQDLKLAENLRKSLGGNEN